MYAATLMKGICAGLTLTFVFASAAILRAQQAAPAEGTQPLVLTGAISLPGVQGRIHHLSTDQKGRLFVSALGNNTEEVADLSSGTPSKKSTTPLSNEYSAPTTSSPWLRTSCSMISDPCRK